MSNHKKILLFEPWGLGDLSIALYAARELHRHDYDVAVVCDEKWAPWVKTLPYVNQTIAVSLPWVAETAKYNPLRYNLKEWLFTRKIIKLFDPEVCLELRNDIRSKLFLQVFGCGKTISPQGHYSSRYQRPVAVLQSLNISSHLPKHTIPAVPTRQICCFFNAAWQNRQVPPEKANEIVQELLNKDFKVSVLVTNAEEQLQWSQLATNSGGLLNIHQDSITGCLNILKSSDLCISTNTSWLHLAYLHQVPVIGLFGFDTSSEWAPPGCQVVNSRSLMPASARYRKSEILSPSQPLADIDINDIIAALTQLGFQNL